MMNIGLDIFPDFFGKPMQKGEGEISHEEELNSLCRLIEKGAADLHEDAIRSR
jgi:hypothetical protein